MMVDNLSDSDSNVNDYDMIGGNDSETDDDDDDLDIDLINEEIKSEQNKSSMDINTIDEFDIEELENITKEDVNYDKDADQINKSLQQIIDKTEIEEKNDKLGQIVKWDDSKDNNMYDDELFNVYSKVYRYVEYHYDQTFYYELT
jgi:hypothetical protein